MDLYDECTILDYKLNVKFDGESGLDFGGLTTDLFTSFWDAAFEAYFEGDTVKVPFVRPQQQLESRPVFEKLGRILYHGWLLTNQIPVRFCEASFVTLVHGEDAVDEHTLETSFLLYLSQFERDVLTQALSTSELASFQEDAILGVYQQYDMTCIPAKTPEQLRNHVITMARSQFVYKPMSTLMWMKNGIAGEKITTLQGLLPVNKIKKLYQALIPSRQKVLAKITYPEDLKPEESRVLSYLRNYIGTLDENLLDKFCRFVTGSPSAPQMPIHVGFNSTTGVRRFPSSSTCSSTLHLSTSYLSFTEFKKEFNVVLIENTSFEMGVL